MKTFIGILLAAAFSMGLAAAEDRPPRDQIHAAAAAGDLAKVRALVEAEPSCVDLRNEAGDTPLRMACASNRGAVAEFLLEKGAGVNAPNKAGLTPLHAASTARNRDIGLIRRLLDKGADVNAHLNRGLTALHWVAAAGDLEVARLLLDRGADPNAYDTVCYGSVLHMATNFSPNEATPMLLVERGARIDRRFSFGNTILHLAAMRGSADLVRFLLARGADVEAFNDYGNTALTYAAKLGYRRTAEVLIAAKAKKNAILESNYGAAPQLTSPLANGEAHLWYLGGLYGGGFAVRTKERLLIFDKTEVDESAEAGLANGRLNPRELAGQKVTVLITKIQGASSESGFCDIARRLPNARLILDSKPAEITCDLPGRRVAAPGERFSLDGLQVTAIAATGRGYGGAEGLAYLVEADGLRILHAGFLTAGYGRTQAERFIGQVDLLQKSGPIDIVILPVEGHLPVDYNLCLYLLDQLAPKAVYLMGGDAATEQYARCVEVLRERNIPLAYPEGGRAIGERFHFRKQQTQAARLPDYLNQRLPGPAPEVFARDVVSTDNLEHSAPAFSPDGNDIFWSMWRRPDRGEPQVIMTMHRENGAWSKPAVAPFSGKHLDGGPAFSPDGQRLYFYSTRPTPAGPTSDDIWFTQRRGDGWSEPRCLEFVARFPEFKSVYQPSIARNGALYFISQQKGAPPDKFLIWRSERVNGEHRKPELLPPGINDPRAFVNWTPYIAPDESYLIFSSGRLPGHGGGDLYVSFRNAGGGWTDPVGLGATINTDRQERFPSVSPDGKRLFFTRSTPDYSHDVFWADADVIEPLRWQAHGWTSPAGDYLGQPPPVAAPEVFARGIVSTDGKEHGVPSFSPDGNEVFWPSGSPPNPAWAGRALTARRENGRWSAPRLSPFQSMVAFSADGRRLYFGARRPGATREDGQQDIWVAEKRADDWGAPECLNLISQSPDLQFATWPTIARNGNLYFISSVPQQRNKIGIARAQFMNGKYAKPELLPGNINMAPYRNWAPFIAPDESYLIFSSTRPGSLDAEGDLFISYPPAGGGWTDPKPLGAAINTGMQERFSGLSADGKYFFFTRWSPDRDEDVYWVSAAAIPELRQAADPSQEHAK